MHVYLCYEKLDTKFVLNGRGSILSSSLPTPAATNFSHSTHSTPNSTTLKKPGNKNWRKWKQNGVFPLIK